MGIVGVMSNRRTITPKQSAFVGFVVEGDNNTEAYRKAYNASRMSEQVIRNCAYKLSKNENVQEAIKSLRVDRKVVDRTTEKLSNDWVIQRLQDEAMSEKNPPATRVRALELLGKTGGLFDESTHVTFEHRSPEDIEKELLEKLGLVMNLKM